MNTANSWIAGEWQAAESGQTFPVYNPSTGECLAHVAGCGELETERAIASAATALITWRVLPAYERSKLLLKLCAIIEADKSAIARTLSLEQGKPLKDATAEIEFGITLISWFAEEGKRIAGKTIESPRPNHRSMVTYEPVGVCAAITPWNFPFAMVARKVAPALAAGCTVVLKPAPETPLTALKFASYTEQAGFPAGVFNCVTGDAEKIGATLMSSPTVRKLSFTGSTEVGKLLIRQSAETVKKLTLELGGSSPFIILDQAAIDNAIQGLLWAKYRNAGQACVGANRILVHRDIEQTFLKKYVEISSTLVVGDGFDAKVNIGPLISTESVARIHGLMKDALDKGASLVLGKLPDPSSHWVTPTILSGVNSGMRIWHEEIFGPVSAVRTFSNEEEALALANDTSYGLAAYVYGSNQGQCDRIAKHLEAGMVCINDCVLAGAQIPFCGVKQSGYGVEGGTDAIYQYLQSKYLSLGSAPATQL